MSHQLPDDSEEEDQVVMNHDAHNTDILVRQHEELISDLLPDSPFGSQTKCLIVI